jgi:thioredoxin 1
MQLVFIIVGGVAGAALGLLAGLLYKRRKGSEGQNVPIFVMLGILVGCLGGVEVYRLTAKVHSENIIPIRDANHFDELVLKSDKPVLVDFWQPDCPPCESMAPIIAQIADETAGRALVVSVNVAEQGELATRYGVTGVPCYIIMRKGKIVRVFSGPQAKETLLDSLLSEKHAP